MSNIKPTEVKEDSKLESVKGPISSEHDTCCDEDHDDTKPTLGGAEPIEKSEGDGIPNIVKTIIYYGMGEGRKPDPSKILYYERPDGSCIDVGAGGSICPRPAVCDHLPSRSITTDENDVLSAMINGAMDGDDYNALDENGLISELGKKVWAKLQEAAVVRANMAKSQELAKSDDGEEKEEESEPEDSAEDETEEDSTSPKESDEDAKAEDSDETAQESHEATSEEEPAVDDDGQLTQLKDEVGDDVFQEIMDLAMAKAINAIGGGDGGEGLEGKIRTIVHQVLDELFSEGEPESETEESAVEPEEAE